MNKEIFTWKQLFFSSATMMTNSIISRSPRFMRNIYLYSAVFVRRTKRKRPSLDEFEHFVANILVGGVLNQLSVRFAVSLIGNFFMSRRSTVLDNRLEYHQSIESGVRVWREHFLLHLLNRIFWTEMTKWINWFWWFIQEHKTFNSRYIVLPNQITNDHDTRPIWFQFEVRSRSLCVIKMMTGNH